MTNESIWHAIEEVAENELDHRLEEYTLANWENQPCEPWREWEGLDLTIFPSIWKGRRGVVVTVWAGDGVAAMTHRYEPEQPTYRWMVAIAADVSPNNSEHFWLSVDDWETDESILLRRSGYEEDAARCCWEWFIEQNGAFTEVQDPIDGTRAMTYAKEYLVRETLEVWDDESGWVEKESAILMIDPEEMMA
jgi:hypothetical protein